MNDDLVGLFLMVSAAIGAFVAGLAYGYHFAISRAAATWFQEALERGRRHDENVARLKRVYGESVAEFDASARTYSGRRLLERDDAVLGEGEVFIDDEWPGRR